MVISKHILGTFDEALTSLRNDLLMMAGLAERSLDRALKGLLQRDDDLCTHASLRATRDHQVLRENAHRPESAQPRPLRMPPL